MNTRIVKIFERLRKSANKYSNILWDLKRELNISNAISYNVTGVVKIIVAGKKNEKINIIKPRK